DEQDRVAAGAGLPAQRLGNVTLTQAHRAAENHRLLALQVAAGGEIANLAGRDLGVEAEVELSQGLDLVEMGAVDAGLERARLPARDLVFEQHLQELDVTQLVVVGLAEARLQTLEHAAQVGALELGLAGKGVHEIPPARTS